MLPPSFAVVALQLHYSCTSILTRPGNIFLEGKGGVCVENIHYEENSANNFTKDTKSV